MISPSQQAWVGSEMQNQTYAKYFIPALDGSLFTVFLTPSQSVVIKVPRIFHGLGNH